MRMCDSLCGWVLIEAQLGLRSGHDRARLCGRRFSCADVVIEIFLPVLPNGRIHELIRLPDDVTSLTLQDSIAEQEQQPPVHIRRIGWFECTLRMANRVFNTFKRLSRRQRVGVGLSLWKVISDLPEAYRIVSQFRWGSSYIQWIEGCDRLSDRDMQLIRQHIATFARSPHFHLLLMLDGAEPGAIQATFESLKQQLYRNFTCALLDVGGRGDTAFDPDKAPQDIGLNFCTVAQPQVARWLDQLNGTLVERQEWVMLLRPGDVLPAHALYWFACESIARPEAAVLYSDDDVLDEEGLRCQPRFKPDWSLAHFRSTNFVGDAVALRGGEVANAGGVGVECCRYGSYDLLLRVVDVVGDAVGGKVAHIPAVLLHRMRAPSSGGAREDHSGWKASRWNMEALRRHLLRNGVIGVVSETLPECWRVRYQLPDAPPLVSIIVPTRDALELMRRCVQSLLEKTTYPCFEILVVDNQSADSAALAYLKQIAEHGKVRVLCYDQPFNYSAINNMAVREARGKIVCLLNNDTEVISPDWLDEMVGHLLQPKVAVVGAKLYFPDGRVQHAGDTVGPGGCANHLHSLIERNDPGYCNRAAVTQELSAVTAACLVTWKDIYRQLGGLDDENLKVAFNDVDYCLRAREAGYHVVWTPHAELYHHESVSRGKDISPEKARRAKREVAYMRKRWKHVMHNDPFYNPNLSYERPDFSLGYATTTGRIRARCAADAHRANID